ncbi:MAG: peptidoglycan editing factor PgeF [Ruminococcaceae bacterium]|nr:peptidoglycan editing factor PgeF [Oscillospiraceae bacterium]
MKFSDKFYFTEICGVGIFKSENITFPHAFSTRLGGVSTEKIYSSLNLSYSRGDSDENVSENISRFCRTVGSTSPLLVTASQIHSSNVYTVSAADAGKTIPDTDGFVTSEKGIPISVSIADCAPILLEDRENKVVAALHAGWRGTVSGIAAEGVRKMIGLGCDVKNIRAAIGPCIHKCCYEVGEDFFEAVKNARGNDFAQRHIKPSVSGKYHADITSMNGEILLDSGVLFENISVSEKCTCCESELFFSHRASKGQRGALKAVIMLDLI